MPEIPTSNWEYEKPRPKKYRLIVYYYSIDTSPQETHFTTQREAIKEGEDDFHKYEGVRGYTVDKIVAKVIHIKTVRRKREE